MSALRTLVKRRIFNFLHYPCPGADTRPAPTIILLIFASILPAHAFAESQWNPAFLTAVNREVYRATAKHEGIVIWIDRERSEQKIFGNLQLASEPFRPGSLFKLLTAEAAVQAGLKPKFRCAGHAEIGGKKRFCWNRKGHGELDLAGALAQSCNLFFAQLGVELGNGEFKGELARYAFLASKIEGKDILASDLANFAIGDSTDFKMTPLEVAQWWIGLLEKLQRPEYSPLLQGLRRAGREGTASRGVPSGMDVLVKTGTSDSELARYKTDAWFLAAYPAEHPRYALVIFLKEAYGFREPAALARKIFTIARKHL